MSETERRKRAEERRQRAVLRRGTLARAELDLTPVRGEEAVSLVTILTRESWSAAGLEVPTYDRAHTPIRFVPRSRYRG